jgi:hypothetical protein
MAKIICVLVVLGTAVLTTIIVLLLELPPMISISFVLMACLIPLGLSVLYLTKGIHAICSCLKSGDIHRLQEARVIGGITAGVAIVLAAVSVALPSIVTKMPRSGEPLVLTGSVIMFLLALDPFIVALRIPKGTKIADYDSLSGDMSYS